MTITVKRYGDPRLAAWIAGHLLEEAVSVGGCTIRPSGRTFDDVTMGVPVGGMVEHYDVEASEVRHSSRMIEAATWVGTHLPAVEANKHYAFGSWLENGMVVLDVVMVWPEAQLRHAVADARLRGERAVYVLSIGREVTVPADPKYDPDLGDIMRREAR